MLSLSKKIERIESESQLSDYISLAQRLKMEPIKCGSVPYNPFRDITNRSYDPNLPLVSIITVTRNAAETLSQAILSVASQDYKGPIEYLIIDGGSTDDTASIVGQLREHIDCFISEPDSGIYDAMNKGLKRARGKYIALLNADDQYLPSFVNQSVMQLEATNADISYCDWFADNKKISSGPLSVGVFFNHLGVCHNTFMHRHSCFESVGGFDIGFDIISDAKWYRAAYLLGLTFIKIEGAHFKLSLGGISDAGTARQRERMIGEQIRLTQATFPLIDSVQAREIYLANFDLQFCTSIKAHYEAFLFTNAVVSNALRKSIEWNIEHRECYRIFQNESTFSSFVEMVDGLNLKFIRLAELGLPNSDVSVFSKTIDSLVRIQEIKDELKDSKKLICFHYVKSYSTGSETFIYNLINDLANSDAAVRHVVLCDERINNDIRPFSDSIEVPWDQLGDNCGSCIYSILWKSLQPSEIISHFSLNGWRLHKRLSQSQKMLPWINMCHGIDVAMIETNLDYRDWILKYCSIAPNVSFTVVSDYLSSQLRSAGVPEGKIYRVPNAIAPFFLKNCKKEEFWSNNRSLKIVCVGRLIKLKGQHVLLRAMGLVRNRLPEIDFHITFVCGAEESEKQALIALADEIGILDRVTFLPFVDMSANPDFLATHDLLVMPSTFSDDAQPRTESFGLSIVEGIASGLPVIGTNAGGIPEVVGAGDVMTRIVQHGDFEQLAIEVIDMIYQKQEVFAPAKKRAEEKANEFSSETRLTALNGVRAKLRERRKKIVHFCALTFGGAASASLNIHRELLQRGYNSIFVTRSSEEIDHLLNVPNVIRLTPEFSNDFMEIQVPPRPGFTIFSIDDHLISNDTILKVCQDADIINLTWTARFLSTENIAALSKMGKPVYITLRDMHSITGGCHYFHGCQQLSSGCSSCPQFPLPSQSNYAELTVRSKLETWNYEAITFIALSDHSMDTVKASPILSKCRSLKLSNFVDSDLFYFDPVGLEDVDVVKKVFRVGYLPSFHSRVKGHSELYEALKTLHRNRPDVKLEVWLTSSDARLLEGLPFPVKLVGRLDGAAALRAFYNSVDMVAVPSLEETFSNTCVESLACGTPVVGFRTGVLGEILHDAKLGVSVPVGDTDALASAIVEVSERNYDRSSISMTIAEEFGRTKRIDAYIEVFEGVRPGHLRVADASPRTSSDMQGYRAFFRGLARKSNQSVVSSLRHENDWLKQELVKLNHEKEWLKEELVKSNSESARMRESLRRLSRSNWIRFGHKLKVTKALRDVRSGVAE